MMFDIGGGSSEIVWLGFDPRAPIKDARARQGLGVIEARSGDPGRELRRRGRGDEVYEAMIAHVSEALGPFVAREADEARCDRFHLWVPRER